MEIKKSAKADLEGSRLQRLLLGLVVALACVYVGLEYSVEPEDPFDDMELLTRLEAEFELPPVQQQEEEVEKVTVPLEQPKPETKLVVVEENIEEMLDDDEPVEEEVLDNEATDDDSTMEPEPLKEQEDETAPKEKITDLPQFPGGNDSFLKWLDRNLRYTEEMQQRRMHGLVVAEFIVNTDGTVSDIKIVTSLNAICDAEVLRVLNLMPRWTPGKEDGTPCRAKVRTPISFLQDILMK